MASRKRGEELRRSVTASGLWSIKTGEHPYTVRVREDKTPGSNLVFDYRDPHTGRRRTPTVQPVFSVRDGRGKVDPDLAAAAEDLGKIRSAELRAGVAEIAKGAELTVGAAFERYMDPKTGGMAKSVTRQQTMRRARRVWLAWLSLPNPGFRGAETPWNQLTPAVVEGLAFAVKSGPVALPLPNDPYQHGQAPIASRSRGSAGGRLDPAGGIVVAGSVPAATEFVKALSAVYHWLVEKARVKDLENPVAGFPWERLQLGYEPRQERYSRAEMLALLESRHRVDPRFALMLVLSTAAIKRNVEIRLLRRSQVDARKAFVPSGSEAPYGWLWFGGVKGQDPSFHFLTRGQRQALFEAMYGYDDVETGEWCQGYLRELERAYQAGEIEDYPMFPGRRLKAVFGRRRLGGGIIPKDRPSALTPVANLRPREWLQAAEAIAGIEHVEWRSWHGVRRGVSDLLEEETDLGVLTAVGAWKSQRTPERVYLDRRRFKKLVRGRRALERLFGGDSGSDRSALVDQLLVAARAWARGRRATDPDELALLAAVRRLFGDDESTPKSVGEV